MELYHFKIESELMKLPHKNIWSKVKWHLFTGNCLKDQANEIYSN